MMMKFICCEVCILLAACLQGPVKLPTQAEIESMEKDYRKALENSLTAKVVHEFREVYPTMMITLSNYKIPVKKQSLTIKSSLYSRYEFRLDMDLKFDKTWTKVVSFGDPQFQLNEVEKIERLEDGRFSVSYVGGSQRRFGEPEWNTLFEARGSFSALGINLKKDEPVRLFDQYWKAEESRFTEN
jgi:hypothetical protein